MDTRRHTGGDKLEPVATVSYTCGGSTLVIQNAFDGVLVIAGDAVPVER